MKRPIEHIKPPYTLLILAIVFLFYTCGSYNTMETSNSSLESNPKIIFLNYSIKKNSDINRSIRFINKTIADGKLKNTQSNQAGVSGDLICFQLDKKSNILESILVKNPLCKSMEFLDETKSFQRQQIHLDSSRFSIRLQLKPNTKYISISDFSTFENQKNPLVKTEIH